MAIFASYTIKVVNMTIKSLTSYQLHLLQTHPLLCLSSPRCDSQVHSKWSKCQTRLRGGKKRIGAHESAVTLTQAKVAFIFLVWLFNCFFFPPPWRDVLQTVTETWCLAVIRNVHLTWERGLLSQRQVRTANIERLTMKTDDSKKNGHTDPEALCLIWQMSTAVCTVAKIELASVQPHSTTRKAMITTLKSSYSDTSTLWVGAVGGLLRRPK